MIAYAPRLLADGSEAADVLFARLFETTEAGMWSLVAAGVARPAQNERIRTAFLLANDLSLVLLRRQVARATGTDPLSREGLADWTAAVMDVYTGGVFAAPGTPASCQPPEKETER